MIGQHINEGRITLCLIAITIVIFERLTWFAPQGAQILFLEEPINASFDSFESHYSDEGFTINTPGCVIPAINVQDASIKRFINKPTGPQCPNYKHRLLDHNQTHIWVIKKRFKYYGIYNESAFNCCYQPFYRPYSSRGFQYKNVDDRVRYLNCTMFDKHIEVNNEFVKVRCYYNSSFIFDNFFIFTPKKPFTYIRDIPFKIPVNQTEYNVIILGLGSISRQNLYRTMPSTLKWLKTYNAVELKGYNTLGDDAFHNLIPVLLGMNMTELDNTCWPGAYTTFDSCPFIWERFKDMGFYTALVEDTAKFGIFNQGKFGFGGTPTDYYLHPFMHESENMENLIYNGKLDKRKKFKSVKNFEKFVMLKRKDVDIATCMGDRYYYEVLLNYIEKLTATLSASKLFGVFWETSMSRDDLNYPIKMDSAYVKLLENLESTGYLNETILLFLSDHGMNIGDIHMTKQGRIEQRLPFVFILVPPSFRTKYPLAYHNLKANKGRLTTAFDVHKTLIDLVDLSELSEEKILIRSREYYTRDRGISLFLQIPRNRTCQIAGISNERCTCYNNINIPHDNRFLLDAINYLTLQVNELLEPYTYCLKLIVDEIILAKEMMPVYEKNVEWRDFNLIVRMAPGGGMFETMMRLSSDNKTWTIIDHVKRLNFPGFRSYCVDDTNLKLFCYCK